ncbi:MAG TPA: SAM-dependent methyltransferase [Patescibacteria group bacterium]|nr:SAM-dependent methyltransferase [Patescibacteria group bacterium]
MGFVSRAGEKLAYALAVFAIPVTSTICADFGSSTGGFVDCLLQQGARRVYAVETGYGVLDWKLRNDPRVVVLERTNAMHVTLPERADIITNDTSWTKQETIFPNILSNLVQNGVIITLIKPHYEAEASLLHHGTLPEAEAECIAQQTLERLVSQGLSVKGFIKSPLLGKKGGNSEYLAYLQKA